MTSVVRRVLGLSILLSMTVGCSDGSSTGGSPIVGAGGTGVGTGGAGPGSGGAGPGSGGAAPGSGGSTPASGIPVTIADGWADATANAASGIVGAIFSYADPTTAATMDPAAGAPMVGPTACMKGEAAMVDLECTITAEDEAAGAHDCYGKFWGAAIGLNLNQPIDEATGEGVETPMPFNASSLSGFGFTISGANVPVPTALRFKVENAAGEYCTPSDVLVKTGANTILFSDLIDQCWDRSLGGVNPDVTTLTKIAWAVVTNSTATVPFDFCVGDIVAIPN